VLGSLVATISQSLLQNLDHVGNELLECTDVLLIGRVDVLGDLSKGTKGSCANLGALLVNKSSREELEEDGKILGKRIGNGIKKGEEHVNRRFTVGSLLGLSSLVEERKEVGPLGRVHSELQVGNGRDGTRESVTDNSTGIRTILSKENLRSLVGHLAQETLLDLHAKGLRGVLPELAIVNGHALLELYSSKLTNSLVRAASCDLEESGDTFRLLVILSVELGGCLMSDKLSP
jgi:hypothetical protein